MNEPSSAPTTPKRIGPYAVDRQLGVGGMGEVYAGYDDRLDRPVALKRIRTDADGDTARLRARFRREARAAARLRHTTIVQVFDWVETDDSDWIVMELVDGRSLHDVIADAPLLPLRAAEIARRVAEGLAVAHAEGIIHRDLKSANVMIDAAGGVKILDFGIAKMLPRGPDDHSTTVSVEGALIGTVGIMSPEQATGGTVDHRADLFALGILLYEMVIGEVPWRGDNTIEVLTQICTHPHPPVRDQNAAVSANLAGLIDALLEKDPAHRPMSATEVAATLAGIIDRSADAVDGAPADDPSSGAATLDETGVQVAPASPSAQTTLALPGPAHARRRIRPWAAIALAVALPAGSMVAWRYWPTGAGTAARAQTMDIAALSGHALYAHGMERLERYDKEGYVEEAIEAFQRLLAEEEESALAHAGLARAYWRNFTSRSRDPIWLERAVPVAERAVALDPFLAAAQISLGLAYSGAGRLEEAKEAFDEVIRLDPASADAQYGLARLATAEGDNAEAEKHYELAIAQDPDRWELHARVGSLHYRAGRYDQARIAFERVVALVPDSRVGYRNLSGVHYQQGRLSEAAAALQKALEVDPNATIYNNLGVLYFAQGLFAQAASAFERGIELSGGSNRFMTWANLGDAYRWAPGRADDARDAYQRAVQLLRVQLDSTPDDPALRSSLAVVLAKRGDTSAALAMLESDGADGSDAAADASALFRRAIAFEICGDRDRALDALRRSIDSGYSIEDARRDPELISLREDPRFHRLLLDHPGASP